LSGHEGEEEELEHLGEEARDGQQPLEGQFIGDVGDDHEGNCSTLLAPHQEDGDPLLGIYMGHEFEEEVVGEEEEELDGDGGEEGEEEVGGGLADEDLPGTWSKEEEEE